jgi:hypothetical protein
MLDAGLTTDDVRDMLRRRSINSSAVYARVSLERRNGYLRHLERSTADARAHGEGADQLPSILLNIIDPQLILPLEISRTESHRADPPVDPDPLCCGVQCRSGMLSGKPWKRRCPAGLSESYLIYQQFCCCEDHAVEKGQGSR